jgi:hypothetical protein
MTGRTTGIEVFMLIVDDKEIRPYPEVYTTLADAIAGARAAAHRHAAHPEAITEIEDPHPWLFHINWWSDSAAWVVREEIR